ncbi:MAG: FMN-binding negative transcriptional regulator [Pseudobdellovibrionaceae bacterium]
MAKPMTGRANKRPRPFVSLTRTWGLKIYNPQRYRAEDLNEAFDVMDQNSFATMISVSDNKPFVSHLPLTARKKGDKVELIQRCHWSLFLPVYLNHFIIFYDQSLFRIDFNIFFIINRMFR